MKTREFIYVIIIIIEFLLISAIGGSLFLSNEKVKEKDNLIEALGDSLSVTIGKNGEYIAKISVLETQSYKDFLKLKTNDSTILKLQKEVERYKRDLKNSGNVTVIVTETRIDTIWGKHQLGNDTVVLSQINLIENVKDDWIDLSFGYMKGYSIFKLNSLKNEYTVVLGYSQQGLFKQPKPYAEITSYNPYTEVTSLRTYNVSTPNKDKWGLGFNISYGLNFIDNSIRLSPSIGLGVQYNIIQW